jgi:signal transduction histidine kinase
MTGADAIPVDIEIEPFINNTEIEGDALKLKQVFLNVMANAIKFTPAGGKVTVKLATSALDVTVTVADTGCGISKADLQRVLLPFVQADNKLSRRFPGSGLGLAIAREFCMLHNGNLAIDSIEGVGTTVTITLPRHQEVPAGFNPRGRSIVEDGGESGLARRA